MANDKTTDVSLALREQKVQLEIENLKVQVQKNAADAAKASAEARVAELAAVDAERKHAKERAVNSENRVYDFVGSVSGSSCETAIAYLAMWARQSNDPVTLRFSSPGGSVIDGFALYDYILSLRQQGIHVTTVTLGMAASMAGILLQAGDKRVVGPNAYVLIHEIAFGAIGKIGEIEDEVAFARALNERLFKILASRSKMSYEEIAERARRKDWWLDPETVVELGLADEIGCS